MKHEKPAASRLGFGSGKSLHPASLANQRRSVDDLGGYVYRTTCHANVSRRGDRAFASGDWDRNSDPGGPTRGTASVLDHGTAVCPRPGLRGRGPLAHPVIAD